MNESVLSLSTSHRLQPFLILAKSVKGVANANLISDVLAAPGVYVFSELYELPSVIEASKFPEVAPYYTLLEIFMYGSYKDYTEQSAHLPQLNDAQLKKLKHITIVSLAQTTRNLPYRLLQEYLDIPSIRALEDLIIDAFYEGVIVGKLDQQQQLLQVDCTMGRDVRQEHLDEAINVLQAWSENTQKVLSTIDECIQALNSASAERQAERDAYEQQIEQIRRELRNKNKASSASPMETDDPISTNASDGGLGRGKASSNSRRLDTASYEENMDESLHDSTDYSAERGGRAKKRGSKRYMMGRP